ncbi:ABC transporter ATP-binding protein [Desmospora activa]|uniref:Peptide/nickel transport system ATP-binding protein n=1 Tax=Desmospora activa DSM 45169 TaxID=1121389 RepID=A0A2T4Z812_9BACL|nr:dipeptide/oligopeptide/nickel ABC transporter ATP-binding protein [Desmospora activa]PTM58014.1 peptide/nickel transport system ATP-binding protein [Desmospora activa DSM 45169]
MTLLEAENIYKTVDKDISVLQDVSFSLQERACLGLVGESGCGKSTLARCLLQIDAIDQGRILFKGTPLHYKSERQLKPYRRHIQAVFQNPTAALNPKLKIKDSLLDPYLHYRNQVEFKHFHATNSRKFVAQLLEAVELPADLGNRYPHELSGGQKQRVTIARAISIEPAVIILDEPTASLDVLSQESVLRLLDGLREQLGVSYLFISHDLAAVYSMSTSIMVMRQGMIVDQFDKEDLFAPDRHPYTRELIAMFE